MGEQADTVAIADVLRSDVSYGFILFECQTNDYNNPFVLLMYNGQILLLIASKCLDPFF